MNSARSTARAATFALVALFAPLTAATQVLAPGIARLVRVPTATMVETGTADLRFDLLHDTGTLPGTNRQRNFTLSLGFLPRITLTARGTVAKDSITGLDATRDLSASAQVLVFAARGWRPAVSAGVQDVGGAASNFRTSYVVLGKELFGRARATVGYGIGPDVLEGVFGGAEFSLTRAVTLLGEFDADDVNVGIRVLPLPSRWAARGIPRPALDLVWQRATGVTLGVGLRTYLGAIDRPRAVAANARPITRSSAGQPRAQAAAAIQAELIARGLENVRVAIGLVAEEQTVSVEYENRTYNRSELDALGLVFAIAATHTTADVTQLRAVVKELNLTVAEVAVRAASFVSFVNGGLSDDAFAAQIRVSTRAAPRTPGDDATNVGARSWLKVDVFARPRVETTLLTEWGVLDARYSWLPEAQMQLSPGLSASVRGVVPAFRTRNYPGRLSEPYLDRVLLHQALHVPLPPGATRTTALTQVTVGRFNPDLVGVGDELAVSLADGLVLLKGTLARLGPTMGTLDRSVAVANARFRYPDWDATISLSGGRFLDGDVGYITDVSRFVGNTEVGVFVRHSERGSLAGIRFAIPLTVRRELTPWRVRPRLPDVYSYEQRTTILSGRNEVRSDIGRLAATDHELERIFWDRDRLYGAQLRRHVASLREAARRLIETGP